MKGAFIKKNLLVWLQLLFTPILYDLVFAQQANLRFRNLDIDDGLSFNTVSSIFQDSKGRIWIGTVDGLNLFDGNQFIVYKTRLNDSNSIANNQINDIIETQDGKIWFATYGGAGVSIYDPVKDVFQNLNDNVKGVDINDVTKFCNDGNNKLWMSSGSGLYYIDMKTFATRHFKVDYNNPDSINSTLTCVFKDKYGNIWIGAGSVGTLLYDKEKNKFIKIREDNGNSKNLKVNTTRSFVHDSRGNLWIGTDLGLQQYDYKTKKIITHYYNPDNPKGPPKGMARCIFEDNHNRLWVGFQSCLAYYDRDKNEFVKIKHRESNPNSFAGDEVWSMMQDSRGSIWFGTFTHGLSIFDYSLSQFEIIQNDPEDPSSLIGNSVMAFKEDEKGNVWIGIDHAGLDYFDRKTKKFTHYVNDPVNSNTLSSNSVLSIDMDHEGKLWIGTWGGGLNVLDPITKRFRHFFPNPADPNSINGIHIWKAVEDKYHNIFIATQQEGVGYYLRNQNRFVVYRNDMQDTTSININSINYIARDKSDNIWIATARGFARFDYERNYFERFNNEFYINDLYNDNRGTVWVGATGLYAFDIKTKKYKNIFENTDLTSNMVSGIIEDDRGNLWVSTASKGISRVNIKTKEIKTYTLSDGLPSLSFNRRARIKLADGRMMFGTTEGFIIFHPDSIDNNFPNPKLIFTDFQVFNTSVRPGVKDSPLEKHITYTDTIVLDYSQTVFTIYYSALNFLAPERNKYATMLEGFEKNWNYVGAKRDATFTNLDPGEYTFKVKVSVDANIWGLEKQLTIIILPPFYKTWWFRLLITLLIIFIIFSIYRIRLAQIRKANVRLKREVTRRTKELAQKNEMLIEQANVLKETNILLKERQDEIEQKNKMLIEQAEQLNETNAQLEERQMQVEEQSEELLAQKEELETQRDTLAELNATKDKLFSVLAHDLRSPFNTIIGYSDLLYNKIDTYPMEKIKNQIGFIRDGAKDTFGLLNNLLDWSRSQRGVITVEREEMVLSELLESELRMLKQQAARKEITINVAFEGNEIAIWVDSNLISTVIRNLVSNAIKFSNPGKSIDILLSYTEGEIRFSVRDYGTGMPADVADKIFKVSSNVSKRGTAGEKGTGLGLLLCADFIAKHDGKIWVESKEGDGSTFCFSIPLKAE